MPEAARMVINRETLVPIGVAISVVAVIAGGILWTNTKLLEIDYKLRDLARSVETVDQKFDSGMSDRWTRSDMARWTERFRDKNPDLNVPVPGDFKP